MRQEASHESNSSDGDNSRDETAVNTDERDEDRSEASDQQSSPVSPDVNDTNLLNQLESLLLSSQDPETTDEFNTLNKDLDSISDLLDRLDRRSDDLKERLTTLLSDMKSSDWFVELFDGTTNRWSAYIYLFRILLLCIVVAMNVFHHSFLVDQ